MASYQKYIMMGVTTILIPIAKKTLKKIMTKYTEASENDALDESDDTFAPARGSSERKAG